MVVGSIMADEEVLDCLRDANSESQPDEEVFANGDEDSSRDSNSFLHPEYGSTPEQFMPRKSSLIKDTSRRNRRKKTVSFSSMPGERTVVNGKLSNYFLLRLSSAYIRTLRDACIHNLSAGMTRAWQTLMLHLYEARE